MPTSGSATTPGEALIVASRKSWLFSYDAAGAQASANLFSLVMSARANELEPYAYLNSLFEHLPAASTVEQVEALLPWNLKALLDEQKKKAQERSQPSAAARNGGSLPRPPRQKPVRG